MHMRIRLALAILLLAVALPCGVGVAADEMDAATLHQQWLDAINGGDIAAAMDLFTDDATYEYGLTCNDHPCRGKAEIQDEIETMLGRHFQFARTRVEVSHLTASGFDETVVSGWSETRADSYRDAGLERFISVTALGLRGNKIASVTYKGDRNDPQTKRYLDAQPSPSPIQPGTTTEYGRFVDIGGRKLYMECLGTGSPTVILESGLRSGAGASTKVWSGWNTPALYDAFAPNTIQPDIARTTRVCTYDRAGYGWSDQGVLPHTAQTTIEDLHALLHSPGMEGPFVLEGISLGDPIVRFYASTYPDDVAGLVLLDGGHEDGDAREDALVARLTPPDYLQRYRDGVRATRARWLSPQGPGGGFDVDTFYAQVRAAGPLPDVPLVSLAAGMPDNPGDFMGFPYKEARQLNLDLLAEIAHRVPGGTFSVVDTSGHAMNIYVPQLIVSTVRDMVTAIREHTG